MIFAILNILLKKSIYFNLIAKKNVKIHKISD